MPAKPAADSRMVKSLQPVGAAEDDADVADVEDDSEEFVSQGTEPWKPGMSSGDNAVAFPDTGSYSTSCPVMGSAVSTGIVL